MQLFFFFFQKLRANEQKLFLDCKYTKLSFIVKLLHIKCLSGWTNESFTILLQFLNDALSKAIGELQNSFYEAKKMIRDLSLGYVKIDACEENCMLYWKENAKKSYCRVCGPSRWKSSEGSVRGKKVPHKILRYFPITPRLKRLFMSKKTASYMTWHYDKRIDDGVWQC